MTDSKHTPGPWSVFDEKARFPGIEASDIPYSIVVFGGPDEADEEGVQGRTQGEAIANARLIAAAPDLLAAAQSALAFVEYCEGGKGEEHRLFCGDELRAAIAKAKGLA